MGSIKNMKMVKIRELKPYENNTKTHPEDQINALARSIDEFGFLSPCLIDANKNIIAGHGRVMAAERLHIESVPCVYVEGLTEDQRRAYIMADNRLSDLGGWDKKLVSAELTDLQLADFDIELIGFDIEQYIKGFDLKDAGSHFGDERDRTVKEYNLDAVDDEGLTNDFWQMPTIKKDDVIPSRLICFNYARTSKDKVAGIHFFIDDYQFERVWNKPEKYIDILKQYECVLSPDFSLYTEMPMPMKIWNVYRSRMIGQILQNHGIKVIPTISWAEKETFKFCFNGIPEGSIVAVSTIGVKKEDERFHMWADGMQQMIKEIKPSKILVYGGELDFDYNGVEVVYYDNNVLKDWKKRK